MGHFRDLSHVCFSQIAKELVIHRPQKDNDVLNLLRYRLLHRKFTYHITRWIFYVPKVKVDGVKVVYHGSGDPQTPSNGSDWSKASRFLGLLRNSALYPTFVTHLTFTLAGSEGDYTGTPEQKMSQCIAVLNAVGEHVKNLTLDSSLTQIRTFPSWSIASYKITFHRLQTLDIGCFYFPLIAEMLSCSPHIKILRVGRDPRWASIYARIMPQYTKTCQEENRVIKLDSLVVYNATDFGMLYFLEHFTILRAKRIQLNVSVWQPSGLFSLGEGIKSWSVFDEVEHISILTGSPKHRRISVLLEPLQTRNIPFSLVEGP